jgi:hypothetical protein
MNVSSGCGVDPRIWTRRDAKWIAKTVYMVTKPRHLHTSVVKKSAPPAIASLWARRNVCHDAGRSGTSGRPCVLRIRAIVDRPDAMPHVLQRAWDSGVAAGRVVFRHPHRQLPDLAKHATPGGLSHIGPRLCYELSVPAQESIRCHDRRHVA